MVLSRFWYLVLSAVAAVCLGVLLLAFTAYNRARDEDTEALLVKDRVLVEALLKIDARARIDALHGIAADSDVRSSLRRANGRRSDEAIGEIRPGLRDKLRRLNDQLREVKGDILAALDARGKVIAQVGFDENPPIGTGYGEFPLVEAALRGYLRDDMWRLDDKVYRMAARPVIDGGDYAGAILHGMELNEDLSRRLRGAIVASVSFYREGTIIAAFTPPPAEGPSPSPGEVAAGITTVLASAEYQRDGRSGLVPIGQQFVGIYARVTGQAADAGVGYAIVRARTHLDSPQAFVEQAPSQDTAALPWGMLAGGGFGAFLIGMAFVFIERDRHLKRLRGGIESLRGHEHDRIDVTRFRGAYRKLAMGINDGIDRAVEAKTKQLKAAGPSIGSILGPDSGAKSSPFFEEPSAEDVPPPPPAPGGASPFDKPPAARPAPPMPATPAAAPLPVSAPAARPAPPPPPPARPAPPPAPARPPPPAPPRPAPRAPVQGPPPGLPPIDELGAAMKTPLPSTMPMSGERTMIGTGDGSAAAPMPRGPVALSPEEQEMEHFREVFTEFVRIKRECLEPVEGLTFDRFLVTLRKNKDALVTRYGCKTVRFQVHVKDGKAALKATPVKD